MYVCFFVCLSIRWRKSEYGVEFVDGMLWCLIPPTKRKQNENVLQNFCSNSLRSATRFGERCETKTASQPRRAHMYEKRRHSISPQHRISHANFFAVVDQSGTELSVVKQAGARGCRTRTPQPAAKLAPFTATLSPPPPFLPIIPFLFSFLSARNTHRGYLKL